MTAAKMRYETPPMTLTAVWIDATRLHELMMNFSSFVLKDSDHQLHVGFLQIECLVEEGRCMQQRPNPTDC